MSKNYNKLYKTDPEKEEIRGKRVETNPIDEVKEESELKKTYQIIPAKTFKVVDCTSLNIREKPDKTSTILCVISVGDTVLVNSDSLEEDWLNVSIQNDVIGYAMKEYLEEV